MTANAAFLYRPDPNNPGWHIWDIEDKECFNSYAVGPLIVRAEGERGARLRLADPAHRHLNIQGNVHGGVTMALADIAMFATLYIVTNGDAANSVTLNFNCQFISAGKMDAPIDVASEVLRETRRMAFVRGNIEQGDTLIASYAGTLRKPSSR